jgi:hypothetical protein
LVQWSLSKGRGAAAKENRKFVVKAVKSDITDAHQPPKIQTTAKTIIYSQVELVENHISIHEQKSELTPV